MDIQCPTCGEPWDSHHMLNDEPHEWGLSTIELDEILRTNRFAGPGDRIREAAASAGWLFATNSLLSFTRCPACASKPPLCDAASSRLLVTTMSEILDDDEDALTAALADR